MKKQYPNTDEATINEELDIPEKYNCYVPALARWKYLLHPLNDDGEELSYGDAITTALAEDGITTPQGANKNRTYCVVIKDADR